jgi:ureidoglycolate lyase
MYCHALNVSNDLVFALIQHGVQIATHFSHLPTTTNLRGRHLSGTARHDATSRASHAKPISRTPPPPAANPCPRPKLHQCPNSPRKVPCPPHPICGSYSKPSSVAPSFAMAPKMSASNQHVHVEPLSPSAFEGFGEVVQNADQHTGDPARVQRVEANQGSAVKWIDIARMPNWYGGVASRRAADIKVNMFVCKPRRLERRGGKAVFPVKILERHPYTPQMFVPTGLDREDKNTCYLVIVAPTLPSSPSRDREPAYPLPPPMPKRKRSLKERLLGARPNPFTNDHSASTTPTSTTTSSAPRPKGPGLPDLGRIRAFIARGDQSVVYGAGTWHAPMVVLGAKPIEFVVVQWMNGVALDDCQEVEFDASGADGGLVVYLEGVLEGGGAVVRAKL